MNAPGRVSIPAPARHELGLTAQSDLIGYVEDGRFVVESRQHYKDRIRRLATVGRTDTGSVVDELIDDRRAASRAEHEEMGGGAA